MEFITPESILGLVEKLDFPSPGPYTQDWECEVADYTQYVKWMNAYRDRTDLTNEERFALVKVIIESMNIAFGILHPTIEELSRLESILIMDYCLHKNTLEDWADWEQEDLSESHDITPIIRSMIEKAEKSPRLSDQEGTEG